MQGGNFYLIILSIIRTHIYKATNLGHPPLPFHSLLYKVNLSYIQKCQHFRKKSLQLNSCSALNEFLGSHTAPSEDYLPV